MKKLTALAVLLLALFSLTAAAEDIITSPLPVETVEKTEDELEREALLESLVKGIVPVKPGMLYDDFISYLSIIDESDGKMAVSKFNTFIHVIEYYHYGNMTVEEIFARFTEQVDGVDVNNMNEAYAVLFSMMDKFSYYLTPEEAEDFFKPTASKGIGIKMIWKDAEEGIEAGIYVDEVAKGSTAEEAGIAVGDRIVSFNGNNVDGLGFEALTVFSTLVPADAETLAITLKRGEAETEYLLPRKQNTFAEYSITLYPEKKLIYLDINSFMYADTAYGICAELDKLWNQGYHGIIIDLQSNSGGDVYVAAEILSKFTPKREILFYMGRDGRRDSIPFTSLGNGYLFEKISILVDGKTASSAEIFADTLRNIAGAQLIGSNTFGKGVAQSIFTFEDGAAVGITSYVAYDRNGGTYNEVGLVPDSRLTLKVDKNTLPNNTPTFTALNYMKAYEGAENKTVLGLEIRLEAIGFLSESEVDGIWDETTTNAIKAFRIGIGADAEGGLDRVVYDALIEEVRKYQNTYYLLYTPFDYAYRFFKFKA